MSINYQLVWLMLVKHNSCYRILLIFLVVFNNQLCLLFPKQEIGANNSKQFSKTVNFEIISEPIISCRPTCAF